MRGLFGSKNPILLKVIDDSDFSDPKNQAPKALVETHFLKYLLIWLQTFFLVKVLPSLQ